MDQAPSTRWGIIFLILFAGSVGAAQLGKLPGALPDIRADLDISLVTAGWIISTFVMIGAICSVAAGMTGDRFGHRRILLWGIALVAVGSFAGAAAPDSASLIPSRIVEGLGYIAVISTGPALITRAVADRHRAMAFGVWSFYMPFGMASMVALSPVLISATGSWRGLWIINGMLAAIALVALLSALQGERFQPIRNDSPVGLRDVWRTVSSAGPWVVAIAMGSYSLVYLSSMAFLPTFLIEREGMSAGTASVLIGIAIFMNAPGCLAGSWLLKRNVPAWIGIAIAHAGMAVCAAGLYQEGISFELRYALALALPFCGGLIPPIVLARAQVHAPSPALYGTTMGLVIQVISIGQFIGPPTMAALVAATGDWQSGAWLTVIACALGFSTAPMLRRLDRRAGLV
ncbi:MAG: MFS transporter [Alphaproteobacteria bacterium]|nr:MFS transporter [Alphaproteobacteria bacterium]